MALITNVVLQPKYLYWWQWGQVAGLLAPAMLLALGIYHPLLWAVAAHLFIDFTGQSSETATNKAQRDLWTLIYHSFISGGFAGLLVGGLPGLIISVILHFLIDSTKKFGLSEPVGPVLDQAAHLITLIIIWSLL